MHRRFLSLSLSLSPLSLPTHSVGISQLHEPTAWAMLVGQGPSATQRQRWTVPAVQEVRRLTSLVSFTDGIKVNEEFSHTP